MGYFDLPAEIIPPLYIAFIFLNLADVWTTNRVLAQGGREKMWLAGKFIDIFGELWPVPKMLLILVLSWVAFKNNVHEAILIGCVLYIGVVANNYSKIK